MFLEDLPEPDDNCATCLLNDICSSNINSKDSRCKKHLLERSELPSFDDCFAERLKEQGLSYAELSYTQYADGDDEYELRCFYDTIKKLGNFA